MSDFYRETAEILQLSERNWKNRILLLANLSVYGIFRSFQGVQTHDSSLIQEDDVNWKYDIYVLSPDAKHVLIVSGHEKSLTRTIHFTKFTPNYHKNNIIKLLDFRNRYSGCKPYTCSRFHYDASNCEEYVDKLRATHYERIDAVKDWTKYDYYNINVQDSQQCDGNFSTFTCPFNSRMCLLFKLSVASVDDSFTDPKLYQLTPDTISYPCCVQYSCDRTPSILTSRADNNIDLDTIWATSADYSSTISSHNYFDKIYHELPFLRNSDYYMTGDSPTIVEYVDGNIFLFKRLVDTNTIVESWIVDDASSYDGSMDAALQSMTRMVLQGDLFTFEKYENGSISSLPLHISMLQVSYDQDIIDAEYGGSAVYRGNKEHDNLLSLLNKYRFQASRILYLRGHLDGYKDKLNAFLVPKSIQKREEFDDMVMVETTNGSRLTAFKSNNGSNIVYGLVKGVFSSSPLSTEKSILSLDLLTEQINGVLSNGDLVNTTMSVCLNNAALLSEQIDVHDSNHNNTLRTAAYIREMLAFVHHISIPSKVVQDDTINHTSYMSTLAKSAALQSQRFLLKENVANHNITPSKASHVTELLHEKLMKDGSQAQFRAADRADQQYMEVRKNGITYCVPISQHKENNHIRNLIEENSRFLNTSGVSMLSSISSASTNTSTVMSEIPRDSSTIDMILLARDQIDKCKAFSRNIAESRVTL